MTFLIGMDCAAQHRNIGLALGRLEPSGVSVLEVRAGLEDVSPVLERWMGEVGPAILALDSPLGWPTALGASLHPHEAGGPIEPAAHALFRRRTDDFVHDRLGKRPLEVGADRIARAAVSTLKILESLRSASGHPLPLLWEPRTPSSPGIIEVYPAATLLARGVSVRGYKGNGPEPQAAREALLDCLSGELAVEIPRDRLTATDHALDAVFCLLAAADFARGDVHLPAADERERVRKEGWIWFAEGPPGARRVREKAGR